MIMLDKDTKGEWNQENKKKKRFKGVRNEQDHSILNQLNCTGI